MSKTAEWKKNSRKEVQVETGKNIVGQTSTETGIDTNSVVLKISKVWENEVICDGSPKRKNSKNWGLGWGKSGSEGTQKKGFGQENLLAAENTPYSKIGIRKV